MDERVISAYATDLDTGEKQKLTTKQKSNCHFFDRFICGKYEIQLRLDWGEPDIFNNPMLDADFYDLVTHKIVKSQKKHPSHHTPSNTKDNTRVYEWNYEDESKKVLIAIHWSVSAGLESKATLSCSAEVYRDGKIVESD